MYLLNGERRQCVDVSDRGFQYGDGLFETIEVVHGKPLFLKQHLERLLCGCERLLIPPPDLALLSDEAQQISAESEKAVLKIIVTRGCGGRGYRQPETVLPTRLLGLHAFPDYSDSYESMGIVLRFCDQRLSNNPLLAGIKHLNRLEQVLARAEWQDDTIQEGLMLDYDDFVVEGTMSNLFFVSQAVLYTPSLTNSGIKGIVRQMMIDFAELHHLRWMEDQFVKSNVLQADEVFVTNSVIGIWPVRQLDQQCFGVGEITRKMQQWYAQARLKEMRS